MSNSLYSMSLNDEDAATGNNDMVDGVVNHVMYGTASAATSAVVGIANTFRALGSSLGADMKPISEQEVIGDIFGSSTSDYYARHKEIVDVVGMVASMFVPGAIAYKGVQMAASAGKLGAGLMTATGMENAGIIMGSRAVAAAKASAKATGQYGISNPLVQKAMLDGGKVVAAETVLFGLADALVNNQNIALNPDGNSYWESAKTIAMDDITSGLNVGVGLGMAGFFAARINYTAKAGLRTQEKLVNEALFIAPKALSEVPAGDAAYLVRDDLNKLRNDPQYAYETNGRYEGTDQAAVLAGKTRLVAQLEKELKASTAKLVEGQDNVMAPALSKFFLDTSKPNEAYAETAANLLRAGRMSEAESSAQLLLASGKNVPAPVLGNEVKTFMNLNTGQHRTQVVPSIADVKKLDFKNNLLQVFSKNGNVEESVSFNPKAFKFQAELDGELLVRSDPIAYSKQWTLASKYTPPVEDGIVVLKSWDHAPKVEGMLARQITEGIELKGFEIDGNFYTPEMAKAELLAWKQDKLSMLTSTYRYAPEEISKFLNISEEAAVLGKGQEEDFLQMLTGRDMLQPEWSQMTYKKVDVKEVDQQARDIASIQVRQAAQTLSQQTAATQALGEVSGRMISPELLLKNVTDISVTDTRQGKLFALRPEFQTLRDYAAQIGRIAGDLMVDRTQQIEKDFGGFFNTFNHGNATALRAELASTDNILRREWYTVRKVQELDTKGNPTGKQVTAIIAKRQLELLEEQKVNISALTSKDVAQFAKADGFVPSKEVGDFYDYHYAKNNSRTGVHKTLGEANGRSINYKDDVLYPPPRDLKATPHYKFVVPKEMYGTVDKSKYMIVAGSLKELEAKEAAILSKFGDRYVVAGGSDVAVHKKLQGEYEKGQVFDELEFDAGLRREFKDSELAPNLDPVSSGTMERYRQWHAKQEEGVVRAGIETKYGSSFDYLSRQDKIHASTSDNPITKKFQTEQASIWKDTMRTMLALSAKQDTGLQAYQSVSSFVNEAGSKVLDAALRPFVSKAGTLTEKDLDAMNAAAAKVGLLSPYQNVFEMLAASPETIKSRSLPTLVRSLNTLASTTMLTLDMMASIVNAISSPIISLPVVREALKELKGSPQGEALERMLTVANPVSGVKEPTASKLLMDATQKFHTKEGKEFILEARKRRIFNDPFVEYREAQDLADFNGTHGLGVLTQKIENFRASAGKYTGTQKAEDFSKFMTAWSVKQVAELRGIRGEELWSVIGSSVDKTQGVFRATQRGELFNGVVGQAVGLFQSYVFNWLQNGMRNTSRGELGNLAVMGAMQAGLFGVRSLPGFDVVNTAIGERNRDNQDLYTFTQSTEYDKDGNAVNPWMQYVMYGMGSHALGFPVDMFNRGDMNPRQGQPLYFPNPADISQYPAFNLVGNAIANVMNIGSAVMGDASLGQALVHGLAHNSMNRPLQGIGTIMQGSVTSKKGMVTTENANYINNDLLLGLDASSMIARGLGSRPMREAVLMDEMFRQKAYDASDKEKIQQIGFEMKLSMADGEELDDEAYDKFALKYEAAGGKPQNFNAYMAKILKSQDQGTVNKFKEKMQADSVAKRAYRRMLEEQDQTALYDLYPQAFPAQQ